MKSVDDLIKAGGYRTGMNFNKDFYPDQIEEMWKIGSDYYWVEKNIIICKMTDSHSKDYSK
jgi:hypothetical protein